MWRLRCRIRLVNVGENDGMEDYFIGINVDRRHVADAHEYRLTQGRNDSGDGDRQTLRFDTAVTQECAARFYIFYRSLKTKFYHISQFNNIRVFPKIIFDLLIL